MDPLADPLARARSPGSGRMPERGFAALTPELVVLDLDASLRFWCGLLGFTVAYDRTAARFAYLVRGDAQIMLCQHNGRWSTGALEQPFGRGVNFQIMVDRLDPILTALGAARWPLFDGPSEAWYRIGPVEGGQRECLVQDPDGYLVRLAENLGQRLPATPP
jgi:catechol 2,3-dioxygenase-like lactoylglutathione lyase family enzyme